MKKYLIILFVGGFIFILLGLSKDYRVAHNSDSDKIYHRFNCKYAIEEIPKENLIIFQSPKDAEKKGYRPCKESYYIDCEAEIIN